MQESWSASSDETPPRFQTLKRSCWKSHPEEIKINCCGTFNYQSSSKLDSNCLETYRYDHSIYFKTIGDIRSDKREEDQNQNQDSTSVSSEEQIEWDASSLTDTISNKLSSEEINNISGIATEREEGRTTQNIWPIVDLSKLDLNLIDNRGRDELLSYLTDEENCGKDRRQMENNNLIFLDNSLKDKMDKEDQKDGSNGQKRTRKREFRTFRKTKRSSKNLR